MGYKKLLFLICITIIASLIACSDDEFENYNIDYGYDYFPLIVGKTKIYQIDSITYDTVPGKTIIDSVRFYLMENIVESFINAKGDSVFRIERFTRKADNQAWQFKDVVSAEKSQNLVFRNEQNFRILKLAFPLSIRSQWNPTQFIDSDVEVQAGKEKIKMFQYWNAEVNEIDETIEILGKKYTNSISINQANSDNAIELRKVKERYARGIGLISNEMEILDTQSISNAPWCKKAQQGFILRQYLLSY